MNKKFLLLSSVLLFTCSSPSYLEASYTETESYESKTVGRIDVQMEKLASDAPFDPKPVLVKLKTKVGDPFSQMVFDNDLKTLSEEYDRLEPSIDMLNGQLYLTIKVWARPIISQIEWVGNLHFSSKTLQKELGIKPKKTFNRTEFNKAFSKVKEYYVKKGYFESQLFYNLIPDPKTGQVKISVTVHEGRSGVIENIIFKGFTLKEKSHLLNMIYTKKYNFFTSWLTGSGIFNEEAVEQDKLTIANFLQNKGYADAKVDIQVNESQVQGKVVLIVSVDRGPVFRFGQLSFKGNSLFSNEEIEKVFTVRPESTYATDKLRQTAQSIRDLYGRKGFIETNVQFEIQMVADQPIYNVHFEIEEGEEYKIGLIRVFGNVQTQTHVILRESLLIPGETFDSAKLKATQQRLELIGYFKNVNVYAVRTQDDELLGEKYRDVYIEVDEITTGNMSLFFGLSSADGVFGGLDITETNFNYKGIGYLFKDGPSALRGGGEYAHAKITLGAKQRSYNMSWLTPYFRDTLWKVGFDVFFSQTQLENKKKHEVKENHKYKKKYEIDSFGGSVYAFYPLNAYWSFGTKYRFKHGKTYVDKKASEEQKELRKLDGNVSAIGTTLNFDSTDSIMKPHRGFRSGLEAEYAGIGGDYFFMKYSYANTYYQQLWKRGILKSRWEYRFIQPIPGLGTKKAKNIPVFERFFLGGENSVRGYKAFDLGEHFENGDPKGGTSASVLSVEYLQEIISVLDAFAFIDAGSVKLQTFQLSKYKMSWGVGVRLEVMNRMPITLGVGFPVNPDSKSQVQKFFFSMGGQF